MSEPIIIIGVDHGYAAMKTAHFSFHTGLVAHEHEPYTLNNVLEYGGKYYVVGSGRQPLQKDKTQTEDYYLLIEAHIQDIYGVEVSDTTVSRITDKILPIAKEWQHSLLIACRNNLLHTGMSRVKMEWYPLSAVANSPKIC